MSCRANTSATCVPDAAQKLPEIKFKKLFINGQFVDAVSGKTFETIDPRTEEVIARISEGDMGDVELAVKAARAAFDKGPWPRMTGSERGRLMQKLADLIEQNVDELAALDALDTGKPVAVARVVDIPDAPKYLRYYAGAADKIHGQTLKMSHSLLGYTLLEPIGVVGLIVPWNYPTTLLWQPVGFGTRHGFSKTLKRNGGHCFYRSK